jgi:hypothetical protein
MTASVRHGVRGDETQHDMERPPMQVLTIALHEQRASKLAMS